jgi:hypothetical protein
MAGYSKIIDDAFFFRFPGRFHSAIFHQVKVGILGRIQHVNVVEVEIIRPKVLHAGFKVGLETVVITAGRLADEEYLIPNFFHYRAKKDLGVCVNTSRVPVIDAEAQGAMQHFFGLFRLVTKRFGVSTPQAQTEDRDICSGSAQLPARDDYPGFGFLRQGGYSARRSHGSTGYGDFSQKVPTACI